MGRQSTTMRICIFLLASLLSPSLSAPTETDRLPQFLQALPFFSELQDLQQTFQDLQANIPAEVMAQITQNLPPLLANLLVAGQQQPAGRGLQDVVQQLQQTLQQPAAGRAGSTGTVPLSSTNGGFVFTGRSALDEIETMRKYGGKFGGKYGGGNKGNQGWWNNYNSQKPFFGNYQKPTYGNFQNPNSNLYMYYNPFNGYQYQYPNYIIGTIGDNGVVVPATGTGTTTVTAIREQPE